MNLGAIFGFITHMSQRCATHQEVSRMRYYGLRTTLTKCQWSPVIFT